MCNHSSLQKSNSSWYEKEKKEGVIQRKEGKMEGREEERERKGKKERKKPKGSYKFSFEKVKHQCDNIVSQGYFFRSL